MENFVIGDIHGNIRALQQVCAMAAIDPEQDRLITLGDVADGWFWTPECVEYLSQFKHLVPLMGNHDVWTSEWLNDGKISAIWPPQGGQATIDAYVGWMATVSSADLDRHRRFFRTLHPFFIDEKNRFFVHAGVDLRHPIRRNQLFDFTWDRELWDRAEEIHKEGRRYVLLIDNDEQNNAGSLIVVEDAKMKNPNYVNEVSIGHTTVQTEDNPWLDPQYRAGIWNLDTGAGTNGLLTIMNIDTNDFWQSAPSCILYPEEA